jgi:hypothetical protein
MNQKSWRRNHGVEIMGEESFRGIVKEKSCNRNRGEDGLHSPTCFFSHFGCQGAGGGMPLGGRLGVTSPPWVSL